MHQKFLKKIINFLGYKLVDKNLIKNERLLSNYSYLNLDMILEKIFEKHTIKKIIQIGANDGVRFDKLSKFIKNSDATTILVEPIKTNYEKLKSNYSNKKNVIFENSAISSNNEIQYLFKVDENKTHLYDEHILGLMSFKKSHLIKHGVKRNHIKIENVNSISIKDLIEKYNFNEFELLYIDTEGYDGNIIIDFLETCFIKPFLIFEYIHIEHDTFKKTLKILKEKDYSYFKVEENLLCFSHKKSFF